MTLSLHSIVGDQAPLRGPDDSTQRIVLPLEAFSHSVCRRGFGAMSAPVFSPSAASSEAVIFGATSASTMPLPNRDLHCNTASADFSSRSPRNANAADTPLFGHSTRFGPVWSGSGDEFTSHHQRHHAVSLTLRQHRPTSSGHSIQAASIHYSAGGSSARTPSIAQEPVAWQPLRGALPASAMDGRSPRLARPSSTQTVWYNPALLAYTDYLSQGGRHRGHQDQYNYVLRPPRIVRCSTEGGSRFLCLAKASASQKDCVRSQSQRESLSLNTVSPIRSTTIHETCAICLEPISVGEMVQPMVRCSHIFHHDCIKAMLERRRSEDAAGFNVDLLPLGDRVLCPLCRGPLAAASLSEIPELERDFVSALEGGTAATAVAQIRSSEDFGVPTTGMHAPFSNMGRFATTSLGGTHSSGAETGDMSGRGDSAAIARWRAQTMSVDGSSLVSLGGSSNGLGASGDGASSRVSVIHESATTVQIVFQ